MYKLTKKNNLRLFLLKLGEGSESKLIILSIKKKYKACFLRQGLWNFSTLNIVKVMAPIVWVYFRQYNAM